MYDWGRNKRRTASEKEVNTAVKDFGSRRTVRVYVRKLKLNKWIYLSYNKNKYSRLRSSRGINNKEIL